jgi:hypothetical protein
MLAIEDVLRLRLAAQGLVPGPGLGPTAIVERAVAMQGQDLSAVLQAIALRARADVEEVRAAFDGGALVRSWPMRGTLFATTPRWLAALLSLTSDRIEREMARRRADLGLDQAAVDRSWSVAAERIADGPVPRAELLALWEAAGLEVAAGPGYHLIVLHAILGRWHWGPFIGGEQCLVATPVGDPVTDPDEVLAEVAAGYVRSHGPVTVDDLAWWTKLPKGQVRRALTRCEGLAEQEVEGEAASYLVEETQLAGLPELPPLGGEVILLPAFDEYYLGYQRRDLMASPPMQQSVVPGKNGVFRPVVVLDGRVVATWRRGRGGAAGVRRLAFRQDTRRGRAPAGAGPGTRDRSRRRARRAVTAAMPGRRGPYRRRYLRSIIS